MKTSEKSNPSTTGTKGLQQVMRAHPLVSFFLMAYAFSWIMVIPYILSQWGVLRGDFRIAFVLKSFGPFLAAYIMIGITEGKAGLLRFRRSLGQTRVGWQWYVFILLGIPALFLLGMAFFPGVLASFQGFPANFSVVYLVTLILIFFGGGPLGEEPGWRGFALPRLQPRFGTLRGTLLLGILWTFWHLPDYLNDAQRGGPGTNLLSLLSINLPIFLLMVMGMAVIFTWVFNHTHGSVFIAILLHASINGFGTAMALFNASILANSDLVICIAVVVPALLILILTRGRLGYQPGQDRSLKPAEVEAQASL